MIEMSDSRHLTRLVIPFNNNAGRIDQDNQRLSCRQHLEDLDVAPNLIGAEDLDVLRTQPATVPLDRVEV